MSTNDHLFSFCLCVCCSVLFDPAINARPRFFPLHLYNINSVVLLVCTCFTCLYLFEIIYLKGARCRISVLELKHVCVRVAILFRRCACSCELLKMRVKPAPKSAAGKTLGRDDVSQGDWKKFGLSPPIPEVSIDY